MDDEDKLNLVLQGIGSSKNHGFDSLILIPILSSQLYKWRLNHGEREDYRIWIIALCCRCEYWAWGKEDWQPTTPNNLVVISQLIKEYTCFPPFIFHGWLSRMIESIYVTRSRIIDWLICLNLFKGICFLLVCDYRIESIGAKGIFMEVVGYKIGRMR